MHIGFNESGFHFNLRSFRQAATKFWSETLIQADAQEEGFSASSMTKLLRLLRGLFRLARPVSSEDGHDRAARRDRDWNGD
jgi:hypothetical protein